MPLLCGFYPGICLTTEENAWKNLSQGKNPGPTPLDTGLSGFQNQSGHGD